MSPAEKFRGNYKKSNLNYLDYFFTDIMINFDFVYSKYVQLIIEMSLSFGKCAVHSFLSNNLKFTENVWFLIFKSLILNFTFYVWSKKITKQFWISHKVWYLSHNCETKDLCAFFSDFTQFGLSALISIVWYSWVAETCTQRNCVPDRHK